MIDIDDESRRTSLSLRVGELYTVGCHKPRWAYDFDRKKIIDIIPGMMVMCLGWDDGKNLSGNEVFMWSFNHECLIRLVWWFLKPVDDC